MGTVRRDTQCFKESNRESEVLKCDKHRMHARKTTKSRGLRKMQSSRSILKSMKNENGLQLHLSNNVLCISIIAYIFNKNEIITYQYDNKSKYTLLN